VQGTRPYKTFSRMGEHQHSLLSSGSRRSREGELENNLPRSPCRAKQVASLGKPQTLLLFAAARNRAINAMSMHWTSRTTMLA